MGIFLTSGYPQPEATTPLLRAIDRGGADFVELGMPFSDPLAEGVPIQRSSARALENGTTMQHVLNAARDFREGSDTPLILMGYVNPVYRFGVQAFCRAAADAGVDGLILPDLPLDATTLIRQAATDAGLDLILLIAPNTPDDRIQAIDRATTGFVYAVAFAGLTGDRIDTGDPFQNYLQRARTLISNPLMVGFGIRSAEDAHRATRHTDGFIVGSALINLVETLWTRAELPLEDRYREVEAFVRALRPSEGN
jgi:tryptophan synthase alpha chain